MEGWERAIRRFKKEKYEPGDTISRSWFFEAFGIEEPQADTLYAVAKHLNLQFLPQMKRFKQECLLRFKRDVIAAHLTETAGYVVVYPAEQTKLAMAAHLKQTIRATKGAMLRVENVEMRALTAYEKAENTEAQTRLAWFYNTLRRKMDKS